MTQYRVEYQLDRPEGSSAEGVVEHKTYRFVNAYSERGAMTNFRGQIAKEVGRDRASERHCKIVGLTEMEGTTGFFEGLVKVVIASD